MPYQSWSGLLNGGSPYASGAGAVLNTAVTATVSPVTGLSATSDVAVVAASGQPLGWYPGLNLRVTARGFLTTTATSTTWTPFLAANKGNAGTFVTLATLVGITTGTTVLTGIQWKLEAFIRCTNVLTSGNTVSTQGELELTVVDTATPALPANPIAINTATGVSMTLSMPNSGGENAAAVDTTQLQGICMRSTLAAANATVQLTQWLVEALD